MTRRLLWLAPFALGLCLAAIAAHATPPAASPAWVNVVAQCGADPTDTTDSTAAIQSCIGQALAGNYPLYLPSGKYKTTSLLTIDYAGQAGTGFRLISDGATLDGRTIGSGPVLQVICSGGTPGSPIACFYFHEEGSLFVLATSPAANLTTLSAGAGANATVLSVVSTAPFTVGETVDILLSDTSTQADAVTAIGSGTITVGTGLRTSANSGAPISLPSYPFTLGKADFSDQHNSAKIDHLLVNNSSISAGAGGCQFNATYDSDIFAVCDSAGGAAGIALEQVQFSRISGAGSANGTGGRGLVLENGYSFSDTFFGLDLEASPTCLSVTNNHNGNNTWVSPYFNCTTAVSSTGSNNNVLINPQYAAVTNYGPLSTGFTVIGGNRAKWMFPAVGAYVAAPIDDGLSISSFNTPGPTMAVTLPLISAVNPGWSMSFATDNGKGMTISTQGSALIVSGGRNSATMTLGAGNYEYVRLQSDGNAWRVLSSTRSTRLNNGFEPPPWPSNWLYPSTPGYAAQLADNGNTLSSFNTTAGLAVTLPSTTNLPDGWAMGFATDNNKSLSITVNGFSGGHILWPGSGSAVGTISLANTTQGAYEYLVLQYDSAGGSGNFRVIDATPATWQALGTIGSAGISHWSFPTGISTYPAAIADNGNVISAYNSTAGTMTITLPSMTGLPMGWTIGLTNDNGKVANVQTNPTNGGHILYPGSGATVTSATLAPGDYEFMVLRYDGTGFRVTSLTPASATLFGETGADFSLNRFGFPSAATYVAQRADGGNVLSSYNTSAGLTVTLPPISTLYPGWTMGFATDNGKHMTVVANGDGSQILSPAAGGTAMGSILLSTGNYEFLQLKFDGSNFRIVSLQPPTGF